MLIISLILSTILLLIANGLARRAQPSRASILGTSAVFLVGSVFSMCFLPALAIQSLLFCAATVVWGSRSRTPSSFLALSGGATLVAYGCSGIIVFQTERQYANLRARYAYESMEDLLPAPRAVPSRTPLLPDAEQRLWRLEEQIPEHQNTYREYQLQLLHERSVSSFIDSPGFGITRMIRPSERGLTANLRKEPVPLQPGLRSSALWSPSEPGRLAASDEAPLGSLLESSIANFVNPRGFGYFKDRQHVAGFETHRFSEVPEPAERWRVQSLELVSLLLHENPEIYVSAQLPRMDKLGGVPTRPLDRFENFALDELRQGDDIITTQGEGSVRMLGAIRNIRQCIDCHGGDRGALLGAFSYTLRTVGP